LNRLLKHKRVFFNKGLEFVDLLPKYPRDCNEEEKYHVQSAVRTILNNFYQSEDRYSARAWPKYFWRHNYDLVPCRPINLLIRGSQPLTNEQVPTLGQVLVENAAKARRFLDSLASRTRCDIYDPDREEILFGLFARSVRLYCLTSEDPNLWARDMAGIMLRCLADTTITFCYLAKCGEEEEFRKFREYGEGQQKLLMLQLQDNHPDARSLEGQNAEAVSGEMGGFMAELTDIELGHWTKKNARELAYASGLEKLYRLVYTPTSGDLHGMWLSLKNSNLCHCAEPLHRFHRLPSYVEPPLYLETMVVMQALFENCVEVGVEVLSFPPLEPPLKAIPIPSIPADTK
jgi:hypothetical protein